MRHPEKLVKGKFLPPALTVEAREDSVLVSCVGVESTLDYETFLMLRLVLGEHIDLIAHLVNNCEIEDILEAMDNIDELEGME